MVSGALLADIKSRDNPLKTIDLEPRISCVLLNGGATCLSKPPFINSNTERTGPPTTGKAAFAEFRYDACEGQNA